jgi:DNA-directed RNA polymerase subunit RPC12/RpoP
VIEMNSVHTYICVDCAKKWTMIMAELDKLKDYECPYCESKHLINMTEFITGKKKMIEWCAEHH